MLLLAYFDCLNKTYFNKSLLIRGNKAIFVIDYCHY